MRTYLKHGRAIRRIAAAGTLIAAVAPAAGAIAAQAGGTPAVSPGVQPLGPTTTCFWGAPWANVGPINQLHYTSPNTLGPDTDVGYYYTRFQLPAGATVTLHGQFPHSRFTSLTTYKTVGGVAGISSTWLLDKQIKPDRGSINPFLPGAARNSNKRAYTVTISGQVPPAIPARNTLYAGQAGMTGQTQQVELGFRVYRPDSGYNAAGGVPLPAPTVNLPGGAKPTGQAACTALADHGGASALPSAKLGVSPALYQAARDLAPAPHPAVAPVHWYRFFNQQRLLEPFYAGTSKANLIPSLSTAITPSFYPNPANAFVYAYVDRTLGPNHNGHNILVLHAKMPTHPNTYDRDTKNDYAGKQLRYWSLSNSGSFANPPLLPANSTSLFDEGVPTNKAGYYTIVVSLPQDRPKNATDKCGVAWMNWGTAGDGQGRKTLDVLTIREEIDSPTFAQGIDKVTTPDTERQVMGAYYPNGTYTTKAQFQKQGCKA